MTPEDRDAQRQALAAWAKEEEELRAKGVYIPLFDTKDTKDLEAALKAIAKAKLVSRRQISIEVQDENGRMRHLIERAGSEDILVQILLMRALSGGESR